MNQKFEIVTTAEFEVIPAPATTNDSEQPAPSDEEKE